MKDQSYALDALDKNIEAKLRYSFKRQRGANVLKQKPEPSPNERILYSN